MALHNGQERGHPTSARRSTRSRGRSAFCYDLRHTALTHNAAVNPQAYVQMRTGQSNDAITERHVHAAQVAFPVEATRNIRLQLEEKLPGLDSNQQPSG